MRFTGLFAPWHVGSSLTKDQTHVPCFGGWILSHCTTTEVHNLSLECKSYDGRIQLLFVVRPQVSSKTGVTNERTDSEQKTSVQDSFSGNTGDGALSQGEVHCAP